MTLRTSDPPPPFTNRLKLVRLKAGESFDVRVCSKELWPYWSHYFNGFSRHCAGKECTCKAPICYSNREWHAVIHVFLPSVAKEYFFEITNHCAILLNDQVPDPKNLRGLRVTISRSKGGDNGRLRARVDPHAHLLNELPPERDPEETMKILLASKPWFDLKPKRT